MARLDFQPGYPLRWPDGRPRTRADQRKPAKWRSGGSALTLTVARKRLLDQLDAMTPYGRDYRTANIVLSTNIRYTASGARDQNVSRRDPGDTGVALYFDLDGRPHVLACDRWTTVQDNIAAIAAHIDALRGQERWGVANLRQAFAGHVALPAPDKAARGWREVLALPGSGVTAAQIGAAYRLAAAKAHPDRGGSDAAMAEVNRARDDALKAIS